MSIFPKQGVDTVQARKRRLQFIKDQIEKQTEWISLKKFVAGMSINLGIRPQVVRREFDLFREWLEDLETRGLDDALEFRFNGQKTK